MPIWKYSVLYSFYKFWILCIMIICGENSDCYEGVYQQFLNGFCGNCLPVAKGLHKRHLEIVVHV